jgi:hypothetical protein
VLPTDNCTLHITDQYISVCAEAGGRFASHSCMHNLPAHGPGPSNSVGDLCRTYCWVAGALAQQCGQAAAIHKLHWVILVYCWYRYTSSSTSPGISLHCGGHVKTLKTNCVSLLMPSLCISPSLAESSSLNCLPTDQPLTGT